MTPDATGPARLPERLPPLREDLKLFPAASHSDGSPAWVIQDPISNAFFRLGWLEFELLSRWSLAVPQVILEVTAAETLLEPAAEELAHLYAFLLQSQLLDIHDVTYTRQLIARFRQAKAGRFKWLLHNYLFIRLPILYPARALRAMLPWLNWVFSRTTAAVIVALSLLGLLLTAQQWDVFVASFLDTLSPPGIFGYLVALAVTKSLHELGHALTATRYGLRVAHMGVAVVVLWPMLYTDTAEAWRLSNHRQRLAIAAAGIITELAIGGLATLAWNLANDGDVKQALFFLATTSWLLSLGLNMSPFMRFDGYFILSDIVDIPNLHERSFAVARVALRNLLFGFADPDPEPLARVRRRALIAFAIVTLLYRLVVFVGIAITVYFYFFKLLGIFLFAVEMVWFVLLPIWREIRVWHQRRGAVRASRKWTLTAIVGALFLVAVWPWNYQVRGQGYAHPTLMHAFYSPVPARLLEHPPSGGLVTAQQPIFVLEAPEQRYRARIAAASVETLDRQLHGLRGLDDGEEQRARLEGRRAMHRAEMQEQMEETERLVLTAPFSGILTDIDPDLAPGVWVGTRDELALLVAPGHWQAELFVDQDELPRLAIGAATRFYPEGRRLAPLTGTVVDIERTRTAILPLELLSAEHGGSIPVLPGQRQQTPRDALYRVRVDLSEAPTEVKVLRGEGVMQGRPESWLGNLLRPMLIVLIRELSF